jgi:cysteinyl-tRNA synthetase
MAIREGDSPLDRLKKFTSYYETQFFKDLEKLGIDKVSIHATPRATDFIDEMMELTTVLLDKGFAYESNGSVYFDVENWKQQSDYGRLKNLDTDTMKQQAESTQERLGEKKSPFDFVLWKASKPNEPSWILKYEGSELEGRPGWHLECSAMGKETLGLPIDIHTGGIDLCFPHHEDELAQSAAGYDTEPVRYWMHNEFLDLDGDKMSKSTGNIWNLSDLEKNGITPKQYRFAILSQHYRKKIAFSVTSCTAAAKGMERIQNYIYSLIEIKENDKFKTDKDSWLKNNESQKTLEEIVEAMSLEFDSHIRNDLNTPRAIAAIHSLFGNHPPETFYPEATDKALEFFEKAERVFGVWDISAKKTDDIPSEILDLAEQRLSAKKERNWAEADGLRDMINQKGYTIKDIPDGFDIIRN